MSILNRLTIKHLMMNKKRTLVTIIGIVLSTALMVGIGLIVSSFFDYSVRQLKNNTGNYHVKLYNIEGSDTKYIKNNKQIKSYTFFKSLGYSVLEKGENEYKPYLYLLGVDDSYYDDLILTSGRFPKSDDEILLSDHILTNGKVKYNLNDKISLKLGSRFIDGKEVLLSNLFSSYEKEEEFREFNKEAKTYTVVGFVERSNFEPFSFPGYNVYTKLNEEDMSNAKDLMTRILYNNPKGVYDKTANVINSTCGKDCHEFYNDSLLSMYGESRFDSFNNFYVRILIFVLTLITIGCTVVIYNSFAISVMERKKQFGLFSSIGATKRQIRHTVFFEAFVVGTIGIVIGLISGIVGIDIVLRITDSMLPEFFDEHIRLSISPMFIVVPIIYMIITILISAFIPSSRASKISPIEAIRLNDDIKVTKKQIKTSFLVNKIFGIEGSLALKNIKRNKKKYRITIVSLVVSMVLFISFSTFLEYGTSSSKYYLEDCNYDISISSSSKTYDEIKKVLNTIEVDEILNYRRGLMYINLDSFKKSFTKDFSSNYLENDFTIDLQTEILVFDDNQYLDFVKRSGLDINNFKGKTVKPIMINSLINHNYEKGTVSKFNVFKNNSRGVFVYSIYDNKKEEVVTEDYTYDVVISNYVPKMLEHDLDSLKMVISNQMFNSLMEKLANDFKGKVSYGDELLDKLHMEYYNQVLITTDDSYLKEKEITKALRNENFVEGEDYYLINVSKEKESSRNFIFVIKMFLYGFISLVTLIGVTSVLNTINTSMSLRAKEFAILRSVGITPFGFNKMLAYESMIYGLKTLLYGLPLSLATIYVMHSVFGEVVYFSDIIIPYKAILIAMVSVFIIVFFTMMYATRKIKKANIIDTIREENI